MNLSENTNWKSANVADLAFILLSPSLIKDGKNTLVLNTTEIVEWLKKLDNNDAELQLFLAIKKVQKLGWYAEQLMAYFFTSYPGFNLLGNNIQLFEDKTTTGEIDFIVEDLKTNQIIQIELATKFYLYYDKFKDKGKIFIGPNATDNFDRKYHHLIENQLKKETPKEVLEITNGRMIDAQIPWVKGVLFYPLSQPDVISTFNYIHPNHTRGWFCSLADLQMNEKLTKLSVFKKMDWLSLSITEQIQKEQFNTYLSDLFTKGHRAVMVLNSKNERGFIMSDAWPN
tara:strand:- start:1843 stop:2697 length:855 start_codon:yes stop_codon:yes gene_type:complete